MENIPVLDAKGLRKFGLTFGGLIAGIFGAIVPWLFGLAYPIWPWVVLAVFGIWAIVAPNTLNPFYKLWMRFGLVLNAIMSRVILGAVFYLAVLPTGLVMKLRKYDPMYRSFDSKTDSYRVQSKIAKDRQMEKPF